MTFIRSATRKYLVMYNNATCCSVLSLRVGCSGEHVLSVGPVEVAALLLQTGKVEEVRGAVDLVVELLRLFGLST